MVTALAAGDPAAHAGRAPRGPVAVVRGIRLAAVERPSEFLGDTACRSAGSVTALLPGAARATPGTSPGDATPGSAGPRRPPAAPAPAGPRRGRLPCGRGPAPRTW